MTKLNIGDLYFEIEDHGPTDGIPLLFIAGLGAQLTSWPDEWIPSFVDQGHRVILMDNRDVGLSVKLTSHGVPDIASLRACKHVTSNLVPYTLDDMAGDAVGVLDCLGITAAHIVGKSMGGLIAQAMMHQFPERILSATLIVTTSGAINLPPMRPDAEKLIFAESYERGKRDGVIDATLAADAVWASPKFPFDPSVRRAQISCQFDRCYDPAGVARQTAALLDYMGKEARLRNLETPTLIVQGMADSIFSPEHGRDIAARIRGSILFEVDGMGHDLEGAAIQMVFDEIASHLDRSSA